MATSTADNSPKELFVLCDGTGDSPEATDRSRTNVQILREMLGISQIGQRNIYSNHHEGWEVDKFQANNKTRIIYYDRGLGAARESSHNSYNPMRFLSYAYNSISSARSQLYAVGISENIKQAYTFLVNNYNPGDKVYLFGFSRGSYTQRLLVTLIRYIGLLDRSKFANQDEVNAAIKQGLSYYDMNIHPDQNPKVIEYRKNCHPSENLIHFLGLWDTVKGPVSEPIRNDGKLSSSVKIARHAIAIDEERPVFKPELWIANTNTDSKQVWFSGVHCDVGGGYKDRDLANIPLRWMIEEAMKFDLVIDKDALTMFPKQPLARQHDSLNSPINYKVTWDQLTGKARRPLLQTAPDESIHESALLRFGKQVSKGNEVITYKPSMLAHILTALRNYSKQRKDLISSIVPPQPYELDDLGESTNLIPKPNFSTPTISMEEAQKEKITQP